MGLRDELTAGLAEFDVRNMVIDREADLNGLPATEVRVFVDVAYENAVVNTEHIFTFAKANAMSADEMVAVMSSYIKSERETYD